MALVTVVVDEERLADASAARLTDLIEAATRARGEARVCLTGGSTPKRLYEALGDEARPWRRRIAWARLHLYWGDERHVPPDHADSNYGMAERALLAHVPIPPVQIHRMRGELPDAQAAADEYEQLLPDAFDVVLLGLGEDAHIASIFPGSPLLGMSGSAEAATLRVDSNRHKNGALRVTAVWAEHLSVWRITLTPNALLAAPSIMMVVAGEAKAWAVREALEGAPDLARRPAQLLRDAGDRVEWFIDAAAARSLAGPSS